ncbi:MAG: hypothetical protein AAFW98_09130, partial [Pseudomonadota bacterium]
MNEQARVDRAQGAPSAKRLGIIMHGVTGRMGMNQHLIRSIAAIRHDGRAGTNLRQRVGDGRVTWPFAGLAPGAK